MSWVQEIEFFIILRFRKGILLQFLLGEDTVDIFDKLSIVELCLVLMELIHILQLLQFILSQMYFHLAYDAPEFVGGDGTFFEWVKVMEVFLHPQSIDFCCVFDVFQ